MINLNECIEKGLIRKHVPSKEQAAASLNKAKTLLLEAKYAFDNEQFNSAIIVGYLVLLNASRAILFRDGYRERSHACVTRYLEVKYKGKIPKDDIDLLDHYRETRHEVQYEADYFAESESAEQMLRFADKFVKLVEEIVNYPRLKPWASCFIEKVCSSLQRVVTSSLQALLTSVPGVALMSIFLAAFTSLSSKRPQ